MRINGQVSDVDAAPLSAEAAERGS